MSFDREDASFRVQMNQEERCSLWPEWKRSPAGWTDMRPASRGRSMTEQGTTQKCEP
jgi:uncharacterized protein YbdZ (MbtH family)